jgi:hypothetical protein
MSNLDRTEDRWRGMKTNPVSKSEEGWESFRARTDNGKLKRPAIVFRSLAPSRYRKVGR